MKKLVPVIILFLLTGCAHYEITAFHTRDYEFQKNTLYIKVYWNLTGPVNDTVTAEGFVEPFNNDIVLQAVRLELAGLDESGKIVNSAEGMPRDLYIESPFYPASPFEINMKLNGKEKSFTIIGSYFHYGIGREPRMDSAQIDFIPLTSR